MIFIFGGAYSGKTEYAKNNFADRKIISNISLIVREIIENGGDPSYEIERLIDENSDAVFISNEVGCGVVPEGKCEREYRETAGRINCRLAEKAERVIRVVCGIGTVIK